MNKKVITYLSILIITCPLFYILSIKAGGLNGGSVFIIALMWMPALSTIITKLIFDHSIKGIGWKIKGIKQIIFAYLIPLMTCCIVYGFTWVSGLGQLQMMDPMAIAMLSTLGILTSMMTAIGEEIGWRGFLLTELRQSFDYSKINMIIGIIWYIYHVPMIIFSNYNNGDVVYSCITFFVMVVAMTIIANTLCLQSNSMWPSVMLHASHNLFVQSIFDVMTVNTGNTLYITGEFGFGIAFCYLLVALVVYSKNKLNI